MENNVTYSEKEVFDEIVWLVKENFVATYARESDTCLRLRFVNGQSFDITIKGV